MTKDKQTQEIRIIRNYDLTLRKWIKYQEKNDYSSVSFTFTKDRVTIFVNERNRFDVGKDEKSFLTMSLPIFATIINHMKDNLEKMDGKFFRYNISTRDQNNQSLKLVIGFGKDETGYYLGFIPTGKKGLKFPMIFNNFYADVVVYNNSSAVMQSELSKAFTTWYLDTVVKAMEKATEINFVESKYLENKKDQHSEAFAGDSFSITEEPTTPVKKEEPKMEDLVPNFDFDLAPKVEPTVETPKEEVKIETVETPAQPSEPVTQPEQPTPETISSTGEDLNMLFDELSTEKPKEEPKIEDSLDDLML